jgi:hypothetical protein
LAIHDLHSEISRSGLTAIATVLALSSTPIAAQDVTETPPPAAETTASPAPEAAPEPVVSEPVATETTATETTAAEPTEAEAPAPAPTTRRAATRTQTTTTSTPRPTSEAASNAAPASAMPATEAMAEAIPVPPPAGATIAPGAMPVDETATPETSAMPSDETLAIVGAAGLGIFALGGIGMAIGRRRKRKEEEAHMAANRAYLDSHPVGIAPASNAPAFARTTDPVMAAGSPGPMLRDAPRTKLPEGFDLSRFGPHVRAAYQGPTEDNPSLSMKHRLRRAAAMDQQLRQNGEMPREVAQRPAAQTRPAMKPLWDANGESFLLRRAATSRTSKPAFQH